MKRIARHLKGVLKAEQGLQFTISGDFNLDLCVDADFAVLWTHEDDQDPVCVKPRTGHVVTLGGCPISLHPSCRLKQQLPLLKQNTLLLPLP